MGVLPAVWGNPLPAQGVLFSDDFKAGLGEPKVSVSGASWNIGGKGFSSEGNGLLVDTSQRGGAALELPAPLDSSPGVYSLSMKVEFPAGSRSKSWVGIGFAAEFGETSGFNHTETPTAGSPWALCRSTGEVAIYAGPGLNHCVYLGSASSTPAETRHVIELILDTTRPGWTLSARVDGKPVTFNSGAGGGSYTYETNPQIHFLAIQSSGALEAPTDQPAGEGPVGRVNKFEFQSVGLPGRAGPAL